MSVTLANLRDSAKIFANMQQSAFLTDAEWALLVNKNYRALYAEVTDVDPQFRVTSSGVTAVTQAANSIALAADFMNLLCVVQDPNTTFERIINPRGIRPTNDDITYRLEGSKIWIEPIAGANGNFGYRYIPQVADLADPGGNMDAELEQFRKYVELGAAIDALSSDEADISAPASLLGVEVTRVRAWATKRRKTDHEVIEDSAGRRRGRYPANGYYLP